MTKPVILLVEDDDFMRELMVTGLVAEGYAVIAAGNARDFSKELRAARPDIVLLDLVLPDGDGLTLMKEVRAVMDVPVIIISGRNDLVDKVAGLELGADDYVGKPMQMREINARIKAQLRRYRSMKKAPPGAEQAKRGAAKHISFGAWTLDRPQMQAFSGAGASANLSAREFRLLEALVLSPHRVLSRGQLLDRAGVDGENVTDRAIDVQILRIRRKLGDKPGPSEIIRSVRGAGYMCAAETRTP